MIWVPSVISPFPPTTSPKTSASFVSSYLTTRISLLSLSDKSTVDVVGNLGVDCALRYWVFLFLVMLFVRHPAARRVREKGALAFGVWCDVEWGVMWVCAATATTAAAVGVIVS